MRDKIIDAIYDAWCDGEDNTEIREKRDDVEKEINLLGLSKKEKKDMRESVSDLLCTAEERAFKDGQGGCLVSTDGGSRRNGHSKYICC